MKISFFKPPTKNTVWITSDTHAFHKNITFGVSNWKNRTNCRQFDNEILMTEHIANEFNKLIMPQDYLLHLGDWSFGGRDKIEHFRSMLNCQNIILCLGNHDQWIRRIDEYDKLFTWIGDYNEFRIGKTLLCFFHFPIASWCEIGHGALHFFGHEHGSYQPRGRSMDVGVDCHDYKPLLLDDMITKLKEIPVPSNIDHHTDPERMN